MHRCIYYSHTAEDLSIIANKFTRQIIMLVIIIVSILNCINKIFRINFCKLNSSYEISNILTTTITSTAL